ncbi:CPBP family intramembrane glutamic endopeptidase [Streptococcus dentiloxodontae]
MSKIKGLLRDNLIWLYFLSFALFLVGDLISGFATPFPLPGFFSKGFQSTFNMYVIFWGIWVATLLFILIFKKKNKATLEAIKPNKTGNTLKMLLLGFLIGFLSNGICALLALWHGDFKLHFYKFEPLHLLLLFLVVFIQSSAEELVCRGFLYQRIKARYNSVPFAIIANALLFAILHLGNDGISALGFMDTLLSGIFFSLFVAGFDSLWMAMACHTTWNFTQNIIFGLPNSGALSKYSIFMMNKESAVSSFAFDKNFGLEGTMLSVTVMCIGCVLIYYLAKKQDKLDLGSQISLF